MKNIKQINDLHTFYNEFFFDTLTTRYCNMYYNNYNTTHPNLTHTKNEMSI